MAHQRTELPQKLDLGLARPRGTGFPCVDDGGGELVQGGGICHASSLHGLSHARRHAAYQESTNAAPPICGPTSGATPQAPEAGFGASEPRPAR